MKNDKLFDAIGDVNEKYVEAARRPVPKTRKMNWKSWGAMAACLALLLAVSIPTLNNQKNKITLSEASHNVAVKYTDNVPEINSEHSLIYLTEEQLFTHFDTVIFKGIVSSIENIELNFNGDKNYRALVKITVEEVIRGDIEANDSLSVLLPCPIGSDVMMTDIETISELKVGMTGIFMPMIYDEGSTWEQNGATLALKDIADYGFADGERYAFLEAENGLIFASWAYESIADATTLDEIRLYIESMIG